jgi:hypothetical protein
MNLHRFDASADTVGNRLSRRATLRTAAAGAAGLAAIAAHRAGLAQDATPETSPEASPVAGGEPVLYVQTFTEGTWTPISDDPGGFVLTLTGVTDSSIAIFGQAQGMVSTVSTDESLASIGVAAGEGATAALVVHAEGGERVVVVELLDPFYDAAGGALIYTVHVVDGEVGESLSLLADRQTDEEFPESFDAGNLFIDTAA